MSGPSQIKLKRRRDDPGPEKLFVKRPRGQGDAGTATYVRHQYGAQQELPTVPQPPPSKEGRTQRTFQLSDSIRTSKSRKLARGRIVPTFVEDRSLDTRSAASVETDKASLQHADQGTATEILKRPGKGAKVNRNDKRPPWASTHAPEHLQSKADDLHEFALSELDREAETKITAVPKLSGARSRELHRQRASPKAMHDVDKDLRMEDDTDYVYDVYVLDASAGAHNAVSEVVGAAGDVGYLIITEEDQAAWEAFIDSEGSDKEFDTDEEDENAEDYYGADYPEDELASDDEHDRDVYNFKRQGGSDEEEWDEDTGVYSDEEEHDRMMNPWKAKTPKSFATCISAADDSE